MPQFTAPAPYAAHMLATAAATLALLAGSAGDPGYEFARSLALAGPRPAAGAAEKRAHRLVAGAFDAAGLSLSRDSFRVPGKGRSRNVIGALPRPRDCLFILMAHADTVPPSPGAEDNGSGVGTLVALAPRIAALQPRCDTWLVATGAEERTYTGQPDHLGASALVRHVRARGRADDLRWALSLDEVGRGRTMWLRSPSRRRFERRVLEAASGTGLTVRWVADEGSGNSDHREFGLAGLTAGKLGVPDNPLRHTAADRAGRLREGTFPRVRRLLEQLLQAG
jgi:aminopeptidase YwaD